MTLSQLQLALYYLQPSLTVLQNYSVCESLINSFEVLKAGQTTTAK